MHENRTGETVLREEMKERLSCLEAGLKEIGSVCVAFSAGVDSSFLLDVAQRVLGGRMMAVTVLGSMVPERDAEEARAFCRERGIRLVTLEADEYAVPAFAANAPDRCYHCKKNIFTRIARIAAENGMAAVVEGSNADDLGDWRPGMKALAELGIRSPMLDCGLTKDDIRTLARHLGVAAWDKPAGACLATRVPFGTPLSPGLLRRIDRAESVLVELGYRGGRVRVHDTLARIELPVGQMAAALAEPARSELVQAMRALDFQHVCLDLEGYVKGSMSRELAQLP